MSQGLQNILKFTNKPKGFILFKVIVSFIGNIIHNIQNRNTWREENKFFFFLETIIIASFEQGNRLIFFEPKIIVFAHNILDPILDLLCRSRSRDCNSGIFSIYNYIFVIVHYQLIFVLSSVRLLNLDCHVLD